MDHELKEEGEGEGESEESSAAFWLGHCPFMSLYLKKLHVVFASTNALRRICFWLHSIGRPRYDKLCDPCYRIFLCHIEEIEYIDYHGFCRSEEYGYEDICDKHA
jgi:hypothetical protein